MTPTEFDRAISVFCHGFAFTRSFTHPYLVESLAERVYTLRDGPRKRDAYRVEEVVASGVPIAELDALAREKTKGHFRVCYLLPVGESDLEMRKEFKALGYRLMATEELLPGSADGEILVQLPRVDPEARFSSDKPRQGYEKGC